MKLKVWTAIILVIISILCVKFVCAAKSPGIVVTLMNQQPDPADPGSYLELRWSVENYGIDPADSVLFELVPEYPFSLDYGQNATRYLTKIAGSDDYSYTLYYKVRVDENAVEGNNEIKLLTILSPNKMKTNPVTKIKMDIQINPTRWEKNIITSALRTKNKMGNELHIGRIANNVASITVKNAI